MVHWFWYVVQQVWPNLVASVIWTVPALTLNNRSLRRHMNKRYWEIESRVIKWRDRNEKS